MTNTSTVEVFESGIGAINLPLMAGMLGSQATRSCHPAFFRRMSHLCALVAGREIKFRLPFLDLTKGQMARRLAELGLSDLACATVSCVHYPLRESPHKQCGVCPACLIRRLAMFVARIQEQPGNYKHDLFGLVERSNAVADKELKYLKACLMQVVQLGLMETEKVIPERIRRHLLGTEVLEPGGSLRPLADLLLQYRHEWLDLVAVGERRGSWWTSLLGSTEPDRSKGFRHAPA